MQRYIFRRLLWFVPTVFLTLTVVFMLLQIVPGDPLSAYSGMESLALTNEQKEVIRHELGLDRPLYVRYFEWFWDLAHLDLGVSISTGTDVWEEMRPRLPATLTLVSMAIVIVIVFSIPFGILCGLFQDKFPDYILRILSLLILSMPSFWLAIIVILILLELWAWFPPLEYGTIFTDPWLTLRQLFFPALILGLRPVGIATRVVRSSLLEVFGEDFLRTARAKGLMERAVIRRHALPNGLLPAITFYGLEFIILIGGAILMEVVFGIPGLGSLLVNAMEVKDIYIVQGCVLFLLFIALTMNLLVDVLYGVVDPRVRFGMK